MTKEKADKYPLRRSNMEGNEDLKEKSHNDNESESYINIESQTESEEYHSSKKIEKENRKLDVANTTISKLQNTNVFNLEKKDGVIKSMQNESEQQKDTIAKLQNKTNFKIKQTTK